jgi:hypothetical protein
MIPAISLIYGEQVVDDIEFCHRHQEVIERYSHGIMTLRGSPLKTLESVALDPASVPGWTHSLASHPGDYAVLQDFFARLSRHYLAIDQRSRSLGSFPSGTESGGPHQERNTKEQRGLFEE